MDNEINETLVGAEQLREMIMHSISLGSNSIASQAYQVKSRVKSHTSIREKITDRRTSGQPNYGPTDVSDIVGVRFLTLFQQDLLSVVERFTSYLISFQPPPTDIFFGNIPIDCIKEIIVYQSSTTEEIYETIFSFLRGYFTSRGFPADFVKIKKKDSRYSSVHFIVLGQVHLQSEIKVIPIEFQLRTVFEDVWGEIHHHLMYKNRLLDGTDNQVFRRAQGDSILGILKSNIDICSEQAKLAFFTLRSEGQGASLAQAKNSAKSNTESVLKDMEILLDARSSSDVEQLRAVIIDAYKALRETTISESPAEVVTRFKHVLSQIESFDKRWSSYAPKEHNTASRYRYLVDMERAAAFYWIGQALNDEGNISAQGEPVALSDAMENFERARQIYFDLTSIEGLSGDPVLNFRIGQIYRKLSMSDLSIVYYRSAYEGTKLSDWTERGSIFALLIPRHLSYLIWKEAEALVQKHIGLERLITMSSTSKRKSPIIQRYLSALKEAFVISHAIDDYKIDLNGLEIRNLDEERMFAYNNALWYAIEYIENGGIVDNIVDDEGHIIFGKEYYMKFRDFKAYDKVETVQLNALDTLIRAASFFDDQENCIVWLCEVQRRKSLGMLDHADEWQQLRVERTIAEALSKLNDLST